MATIILTATLCNLLFVWKNNVCESSYLFTCVIARKAGFVGGEQVVGHF